MEIGEKFTESKSMSARTNIKSKTKKTANNASQNEKSQAPSAMQAAWLKRGLAQAGGKLPLFDQEGQQVSERTVKSCIDKGWAEPWFSNPLKPDWIVCKLTETGKKAILS